MSWRGWRKPNTYEDQNDSCENQRRNIFNYMGMLNIFFCTFLAGLKRLTNCVVLKITFSFFQLISSITMEELQVK